MARDHNKPAITDRAQPDGRQPDGSRVREPALFGRENHRTAITLFRHRPGQKGVALLLVMLVVVLVIVVVTELSLSARVDLKVASNELADFSVEYALRGALDATRYLLKQDGGENTHDGLQDKWGDPEQWLDLNFGEDVRVKIDVVDESRKYNLYWLLKGTPTEKQRARDRLISILDVMREGTAHDLTPAEAADIAARITDYIQVRRAGKKKDYDGIVLPPTRKNFLLSLEELMPFVGKFIFYDQITEEGEKLAGLERYVTIWSDGKTNVNTAEWAVLQCFFPLNERDKADKIIEARDAAADPEQNPELQKPPTMGQQKQEKFVGIQKLDELVKAEAITNRDKEALGAFLGTQSQVFSVFITAKKKSIQRRQRVLIRREKSQLYTLLNEVRTDPRIDLKQDAVDPFSEEGGLTEIDPTSLLKGR